MSAHHTTSSSEPFKKALPWLIVISVMFFLVNLCRMLLSPLLVPIELDLHLSHTQATGLLMFTSFGAGTSLFCNGFISSRIPHRQVIPISAGGYGIALLLLSSAGSLLQIRLGYLLCGLAGGLYFPSGMATLATLTHRDNWGKAVAVHEMAPNLAFICAPLLAEATLHFTDWRGSMRVMACMTIAGAILFMRFGKGGHACGEPPNMQTLPRLARRKETWMFMVLIGVGIALEFGPYSVLPLFLINERSMSRTDANTLLAYSRLVTPLLALAGGWLCKWVGDRVLLLCGFTASTVLLFSIGSVSGPLLIMVIFMQANLPAVMFPAIFKLFADSFPAREQSLVLSMTLPVVVFLTVGGVPTLLGFCGDRGGFGIGFALIGFLCLLCLPIIRRLGKPTA